MLTVGQEPNLEEVIKTGGWLDLKMIRKTGSRARTISDALKL
jgi:hypothetical protein